MVAERQQSKATNSAGVSAARRFDPRHGRVDPLEEHVEVEPAAGDRDHDLAVDHRLQRERVGERTEQLGKYRVNGRSLRLVSSTLSPSRKTMQRNPSHFGS